MNVLKSFILMCLIGILIVCAAPIFGEYVEPSKPHNVWNSIESSSFIIYYKPSVDLRKVEAGLRKRIFYFNPAQITQEARTEDKIAYGMDALFSRVKELLDMYPDMPKLSIRIFKDKAELKGEYFNIFNTRIEAASFYVHKYNTIYASEEGMTDSVIAHEMAHAVIDHYFDVIPPRNVAEVLAAYVDIHLEE